MTGMSSFISVIGKCKTFCEKIYGTFCTLVEQGFGRVVNHHPHEFTNASAFLTADERRWTQMGDGFTKYGSPFGWSGFHFELWLSSASICVHLRLKPT